MAEIRLNITADDKASPVIKNLQNTIKELKTTTESISGKGESSSATYSEAGLGKIIGYLAKAASSVFDKISANKTLTELKEVNESLNSISGNMNELTTHFLNMARPIEKILGPIGGWQKYNDQLKTFKDVIKNIDEALKKSPGDIDSNIPGMIVRQEGRELISSSRGP